MEQKKKTVKLKSFHISDFKCIDKLDAEINGNNFIIFGKNGNGKTSVAQAINRSATRLSPKEISDLPVRIGSKNAHVSTQFVIDEDGKEKNILIETTYRPSGSIVKVIDLANNGQLTPPVEMIQKLLGESHDVSSLMDLSPEDQFKEILKMLGGKNVSEYFEEQYDELYNSRKNINRLIKENETLLKENEPSVGVMRDFRTQGLYTERKSKDTLPPKPDHAVILVQKKDDEAHNDKVKRARERKSEIEERIGYLKKQLAIEEEKLTLANQWLNDNPEKDLSLYPQQELKFAEELKEWERKEKELEQYNETVDQIQSYLSRQSALELNRKRKDEIQKQMDELNDKMKKSIAELKLDELVPELTIKNELDESGYKPIWRKGIYYKNWDGSLLPFNVRQISLGKMIVALCKLSGFINHEKFNLFSIPAWNELDNESKEEVLKFIEENEDLGIQLMVEQVDEKPLGIKIIEKKTPDAKSK